MTIQTQTVLIAREQIGKPYVLGGAGPNNFDCRGLVWYSWFHAGLTDFALTDSYHMASMGVPVSTTNRAEWADGDLIFPAVPGEAAYGHVQLWDATRQQVIEAPHTGADVIEQAEWTVDIEAVRRIGQTYPGTVLADRAAQYPDRTGILTWQAAVGVTADGYFGPDTLAATKARQAYMDVTADGDVGPATWRAVFGSS